MTETGGEMVALRVSDADRNGTMRRLHNAVALGLIDINEFEQRSSQVSYARHPGRAGRAGRRPARAGRDRHVRGRPGRTARLGRLAQAPRRMDGAHPAGAGAPARARSNSTSPRPGSRARWWSSNSTCGSARWTSGCPRAPARRSTTSRSTAAAPATAARTRRREGAAARRADRPGGVRLGDHPGAAALVDPRPLDGPHRGGRALSWPHACSHRAFRRSVVPDSAGAQVGSRARNTSASRPRRRAASRGCRRPR